MTGSVLPAVTSTLPASPAVLPAVTSTLTGVTGSVLPAVTGALTGVTGSVLPTVTSTVTGVTRRAARRHEHRDREHRDGGPQPGYPSRPERFRRVLGAAHRHRSAAAALTAGLADGLRSLSAPLRIGSSPASPA